MTKEEFAKIFVLLAANSPQQEVTTQQIDIYYSVLGHFEEGVLRAAVLHVITQHTSAWIPSAGKVYQAAVEILSNARGELNSYDAFSLAVKAVRRYGYARRPELPEAVWNAIEGVGGWRAFCMSEEGDAALRSRFIQAYERGQQRRVSQQAMLPAVREQVVLLSQALTSAKQLSSGASHD